MADVRVSRHVVVCCLVIEFSYGSGCHASTHSYSYFLWAWPEGVQTLDRKLSPYFHLSDLGFNRTKILWCKILWSWDWKSLVSQLIMFNPYCREFTTLKASSFSRRVVDLDFFQGGKHDSVEIRSRWTWQLEVRWARKSVEGKQFSSCTMVWRQVIAGWLVGCLSS